MKSKLLDKKNQGKLKAAAWLLILGGLASAFYPFWRTMRPHVEARREARSFMARVQIGDSPAQVEKKFAEGNYRTLQLRKSEPQSWAVRTPHEFGAGNWIIYLQFDENRQVAAMRLRIADGPAFRPREEAPADKISP